MNQRHYDLIVIGSGPAGEKGAAQAAYFGKKVALIEKQPHPGGAAANTGTLPSKTLRETALYLTGFRQRGLYGAKFSLNDKVTAQDFLARERVVVETERARILKNLQRHKIDVMSGTAAFADPNKLSVLASDGTEQSLSAHVFLIATGSHPYRPTNFPFEDPRVYDSDTILNLQEIPSSMLVAGGGVIGCEYACMFATLGIKVSLVEGRDRVLGFLDGEVSSLLARKLIDLGVELLMPDSIEAIACGETLCVRLRSGKTVHCHSLLAATGRSGNTAGLGLERIGIHPTSRGTLEVNDRYQTPIPHIYAAGDVIGFPALASTSMEQARIAIVHAFDLKYKDHLAPVLPYGIYTIPESSMAGETEESAQNKNIVYVVGRTGYSTNARGQIIGEQDGFLKLLFRADTMQLIGVHVIGEQASELVHVGVTAMMMGATADLFIQTCFNYPTLGEMYKYAAYDALGNKQKERFGSIQPR